MLIRKLSQRVHLGASTLLLTLLGGMFPLLTPVAYAGTTPVAAVELSPTPVNQTQAVSPNIVMTFDDSGSMQSSRLSDFPPFTTSTTGAQITGTGAADWSGGPWRCANVVDPDHPTTTVTDPARAITMNGVYYNPTITYSPPIFANGSKFSAADATLLAVWVDGMAVNRPIGSVAVTAVALNNNSDLDYPNAGSRTNLMGTKSGSTDNRWQCGNGNVSPLGAGLGGDFWTGKSPMDGAVHQLSDLSSATYPNGGPYYYRLKVTTKVNLNGSGKPLTLTDQAALYNANNWEAVPVPTNQYQNFANWYAYYRTRNQMARTSLSLVFGGLGTTTATGGYGSSVRLAWQNLNDTNFKLPATAIISELLDASGCVATSSTPYSSASNPNSADPQSVQTAGKVTTAPNCYRSAFFNWLFQVSGGGNTFTRSAVARAGTFFSRGNGNTGGTGDLTDPYWEPPQVTTANGNELACRQNYHMLVTDGLWNGNNDGPQRSTLTLPLSTLTLPDGVSFPGTAAAGVTSIYAPQADSESGGNASLSDIAFHYWAKNLRTDLYPSTTGASVSPYFPDSKVGVVSTTTMSGSNVAAANVNNEIYFNPANDPASWPHMSEYLVGLGVSGQLILSTDTDCLVGTSDACLLREGQKNSTASIGWPAPNGNGSGIPANIDDTWHAALAGRGQFFSAGNPQNLIDQITNILNSITTRNAQPSTSAVNASVLSQGALSFNTGYLSADWSGILQAVTLNADGTTAPGFVWDAAAILTDPSKTIPSQRKIITSYETSTGNFGGGTPFESTAANFDTNAKALLMTPASTDGNTNDTLANRIDYLRGVRTQEASVMRQRNKLTGLLGAIIDAQPVFVGAPSSGYTSAWPAGAPEGVAGTAQTYDSFVSANLNRAGTLYVGANDGMLHAFNAALVANPDGTFGPGQSTSGGQELWAYVPRAVYGNLGNLTLRSGFKFAPTVDATPVVRDVFFSDNKWHTILVGGLRMGGRGVYALDITSPTATSEAAAASKVLWEFNSDNSALTSGNLGYTFGTPNIGRLPNGKWVVLIPGGYFPDCSKSDQPAVCATLTGTGAYAAAFPGASNTFTSLFVVNAETGALITELKTPTTVGGKTINSYGLSSPVLGDYNNDQVDDIAFAGDLVGNLWRYDLSSSSPASWTVTLAFQPSSPGDQPITVMPRLFPDPATNRFIVVFGTGKYLGAGDNTSTSAKTQAVYGIRDQLDSSGLPLLVTGTTNLVQQFLTDVAGTGTLAGATLRQLTTNAVPSTKSGWYFNLSPDAGERVVVTPGAVFSTNTAIITTVIPGGSDPCTPTVEGAAMFVDATTGGAGSGVSGLGGGNYVGVLVNNVRTTGTVPSVSAIGGGKSLLPGLTIKGVVSNTTPVAGDVPIWRRRSWVEINNVP